jgi:hypothetical protein
LPDKWLKFTLDHLPRQALASIIALLNVYTQHMPFVVTVLSLVAPLFEIGRLTFSDRAARRADDRSGNNTSRQN